MTQINLPGTDLNVSPLCLGTGNYGTAIDREHAFEMLDRFVELGGSFIDTANIYGNWVKDVERSISEKVIGSWLMERGNRSSIVVGTKGGHFDLESPAASRVSPVEIVKDLDESLVSLRVDSIDLYWLHRDDPSRPVEELIDALDTQQRAGKIRWYGASNWKPARIAAANRYAAETGKTGFSADQVLWNVAPLDRQPYGDPTVDYMSEERFASHVQSGMAEIPYQSQANGLFNKIDSGDANHISQSLQTMYRLVEARERYSRMLKVMDKTGLTITQVVLGYLRGQPFTTVPIIGCKNIEQLEDSMSAIDVALTAEQIASIGCAPHVLSL
jgi:aryl-alcohol dehydrogenase-like predicted oxidoreductase